MRTRSPAELSRERRLDASPHLRRRRWQLGLSLVGAAAGGAVALCQMGLVKSLPDLPGKLFDATKVDASDDAYKRAQTPDALLMLTSYATTVLLVGMGGKQRAHDAPLVPLSFLAKAVADVAVNLKLAREEWKENKALCGYCQTATLASVVSLVLAVPEAVDAWRVLRGAAQRKRVRRAATLLAEAARDASRALGAGGRLGAAGQRILH